MTKKIIIATGGTGGHIFPAYSLAKYLKNIGYSVELTTDDRGLKYLEKYKELNLTKIHSSPLIKKNFFEYFFSISIIIYSIIRSFLLLLFDRPSIVFGMGGYSSFPICIAASILRIKFVVYENNLIIGKANRFLLPFVDKIFVSYKDLHGVPRRYNDKILVIGNIIREDILNSRITNDVTNNFENLKILVLGGSQAAKIFAEVLPPIFLKLKENQIDIKIYHQCQEQQNDKLSEYYKKNEIDFEIFNFTDKIIEYYTKVNLVITRSGASVLGELINVKIPFITIPLPSSADNHQLKNAEFYKNKGYGYLLEEKNINTELYSFIKKIYIDKTLIKNILLNQRQYSDKNIFRNLKNNIDEIIDEKN